MVPSAFRSMRLLERTNIAAVGLSMAAMTATVFSYMLDSNGTFGLATIPSTLVIGSLWARVLRSPKTVGKTRLRVGWLWSVPLAMANAAGAACGLVALDHFNGLSGVFGVMLLAITVGVIFWGPALVATLLFFGYPIARAQRLAEQGLAGKEKGELTVGLACALLSFAALAVTHLVPHSSRQSQDSVLATITAISLLGLAAGGFTSVLAAQRAKRRRAFVEAVAKGEVEHFRLEATNEGQVLMRVVTQGQHYRVADLEEELALIDRDGEVTRVEEKAAARAT